MNPSIAKGKQTAHHDLVVGDSNNPHRKASLWSADRLRASNEKFQINESVPKIYFTGEMVSTTTIHDNCTSKKI
jgi:hypothetical protein